MIKIVLMFLSGLLLCRDDGLKAQRALSPGQAKRHPGLIEYNQGFHALLGQMRITPSLYLGCPMLHHHTLLRNATNKAKVAVTTNNTALASSAKRERGFWTSLASVTVTRYSILSHSMMRNVSRNSL